MNTHPNPARLAHLTAVHLLGRILERLDCQQQVAPSHQRYQAAMQRLAQAMDRVEQAVALREILYTYSGTRR
jgi:hypothetical protein